MLRAKELLADSLKLNQKAGYIDVSAPLSRCPSVRSSPIRFYCHVEKARVDYVDSYQANVSMFARYAVEPDTLYINREDDSGEEQLRYSKCPIGRSG
jgi:hypothetical protein